MMPTANIESDPDMLEVLSPVLGKIRIPQTEGFSFDQGLLGFPEVSDFVLIPAKQSGAFWLQSTEHPPLTFLLIDPFEWVDGFTLTLPDADLGPVMPDLPEDVVILAILTLGGPDHDGPTVNLQGPVALNLKNRRGRQIVLLDSEWGIRHPISFTGTRLAS
jgi:flagellar assembly factor FliW